MAVVAVQRHSKTHTPRLGAAHAAAAVAADVAAAAVVAVAVVAVTPTNPETKI